MFLCAGYMVESLAAEPVVPRPKDMTQGQRLDTMNRLGAKAGAASQWHYRMQPQCVLEVTARHGSESSRTSHLSMHGTKVQLGHDAHAHRYTVRLAWAQAPKAAAAVVFESPSHVDAMFMKLLLSHVRADCAQPGAHAARGRARPVAPQFLDLVTMDESPWTGELGMSAGPRLDEDLLHRWDGVLHDSAGDSLAPA
jgi:hypothetical protein